MKNRLMILITLGLALAGCGGNDVAGERGGSIKVGKQTWEIVPAMQCSVFPGNIVSISGHAQSDENLAIVIDHDPDGRSGIRIGSERGDDGWYSVNGSLKFKIDGKNVQGSAQFSAFAGGTDDLVAGEFNIDC